MKPNTTTSGTTYTTVFDEPKYEPLVEHLLKRSKNLDPRILKMVSERFWELI